MKQIKLLGDSILATGLCIALFATMSCKETNEPDPIPEPVAPAVLNTKIFKSTYPVASGSIAVKDSVVIFLNEGFRKVKTIDNVKYRAMIDEVAIASVVTSPVWATDSLSVILHPTDMLKGNSSFQVSIKAHWEVFENAWKTATWQGAQLTESSTVNFTTGSPALKIESTNIEYLYPIPNQYHFLKDEHPNCFVKLRRGQESLFTLTGYTYAGVFTNFNGMSVETPVTYDATNRLIKFSVPASLQTESIYALKVVARSNSSETSLISYHFRTSKYTTFSAKFSTVAFGMVGEYLTANPYDQPIFNRITSIGEFFDSFEAETKSAELTYGNTNFSVGYSSGLVRLQAVMSGTNWYDNLIYPLAYAPWTDPNFNPVLARKTSVISSPPVEAMYFSNSGSGMLTPTIIASNNAPAVISGTNPELIWRLSLTIYYDYADIQSQVLKKYTNLVATDREKKILATVFPRISAGNYKYQVKYVLPSGQVTTTTSGFMTY
jgi:hypothetical protein